MKSQNNFITVFSLVFAIVFVMFIVGVTRSPMNYISNRVTGFAEVSVVYPDSVSYKGEVYAKSNRYVDGIGHPLYQAYGKYYSGSGQAYEVNNNVVTVKLGEKNTEFASSYQSSYNQVNGISSTSTVTTTTTPTSTTPPVVTDGAILGSNVPGLGASNANAQYTRNSDGTWTKTLNGQTTNIGSSNSLDVYYNLMNSEQKNQVSTPIGSSTGASVTNQNSPLVTSNPTPPQGVAYTTESVNGRSPLIVNGVTIAYVVDGSRNIIDNQGVVVGTFDPVTKVITPDSHSNILNGVTTLDNNYRPAGTGAGSLSAIDVEGTNTPKSIFDIQAINNQEDTYKAKTKTGALLLSLFRGHLKRL